MNEVENKIDEILELIKLETCDKTYAQSNGIQSWQMPEQFISIAGKEEAKQQLLTLLEETEKECFVYMTPTQIQDYKNHRDVTFQNDPRLQELKQPKGDTK